MIIETLRALALRCADCGSVETQGFSLFDFSGKRTHKIHCECGFCKAVVARRQAGYTVYLTCTGCKTGHLLRYDHRAFWRGDRVSLCCPVDGATLGYIDGPELVHPIVHFNHSESAVVPPNPMREDCFENPTVMQAALATLRTISDNGALLCECGNEDVDMEVFSDKIELLCPRCNSTVLIYAENEDDLEVIQKVTRLELPRAGFTCIDARVNSRRTEG